VGCGSDASTSLSALSDDDGTERWNRTDVPVGGAMETTDDVVAVVGYRRCSDRGELTLLDPATGTTKWSTPIEGGFGSRAVALASDLVVSSGASDVRGLDLGDGSPRWTRPAAWPDPLVASRGQTIALAELVQWPDRRGFDSQLSSLDATDGSSEWTVTFEAEQVIDLVVDDDALVFARLSGMSEQRAGHTTVVAIGAADGTVRWSRDLGISEIGTGLMLGDETLVVNLLTMSWIDSEGVELGPSSAVVGLDRRDGTERWRIEGPVDGAVGAGLSATAFDAAGSTVIGRFGDGMVAWDGSTGDTRWRLEATPGDAWIVGDLVLWSSWRGPNGGADRLDAADLGTGDTRWSDTSSALLVRDVVASDGTLLVSRADSPSCD
jgi:outer membrane protein assembly factor BamB